MTVSRTINLSLIGVLVVVLLVGVTLLSTYESNTERRARDHLTTMLMLRESVLRRYFESLRSEVLLWSSRPVVIDVMNTLQQAEQSEDTQTLSGIGDIHISDVPSAATAMKDETLDSRVTKFAEHHQYYDVLFIGTQGDVLFTMAKEADHGTNLVTGPFKDSGLGRLYKSLVSSESNNMAFEDFSRYPPSDNQPAAFLGARVYSEDRFIGIYAIQIPESPINETMQFSAGMGQTGETYLVGQDGLMRSTSRFQDVSTVLDTKVAGPTVSKALAGEDGVEIVDDYRGMSVYSAYRLFEFEGVRWAVLAEQDVAEIEQPILSARLWLAAAFVGLCLIVLLLRLMLLRVVLPASLTTFLGLTFLHFETD